MSIINFFKGTRVAVATVFLSITLLSIILGGFAFALFLGVLIYFGSKEYVSFTKAKGMNPPFKLIIVTCFILLALAGIGYYNYLIPTLTASIFVTFGTILFRGNKATISDLGATLLGIIYGGWLPMHLILLRNIDQNGTNILNWRIPEGLAFLILIFVIISLTDIAAYYVGTKFGKTPLCPEVSPNKTLKGAFGGVAGAVIGSILIGILINLPIYHSIIAGILLSVTAQFGDLCESMMKRDAGFKDSGNVLPGHGGVLDRADSYIFTGTVAYYYFQIFIIGNLFLYSI